MPLPKPKTGETEDAFMSRCMSNDVMSAEYPDQDQRVAVCQNSFRSDKEEQKMAETETLDDFHDEEFETGSFDVKAEIKAEQDEDEIGKFSGYGSIFGNKDLGNDIVVEGAFSKSIARKGAKGVKLLYQHRADEPIGVFDEIIEDRKGLRVKGRLAMGTQRGREVYELMKMGALDGLSIGFRVDNKGYDYDDRGKRRMLKEVDLLEISAVTFPMNPRARVAQVKAVDRTVREWEEILRDAGGLSRSEAKVAAGAVAKAFDQREAGKSEEPEVISAIQHLTEILKS